MSEMSLTDRTAYRNSDQPGWDGVNPATCDDLIWQEVSGMCGGCGSETCHDGPCGVFAVIDPMYGHRRLVCDKCPDRKAEGWFA